MPTLVSDTGQWRQRLKESLPAPLSRAFFGGSKRELLAQTTITLMVFDDQLVHLETGNSAALQDITSSIDPTQLAQLARSLVAENAAEKAEKSVLLLLPPAEFVATTVSLPGLARESLVSALKLQTETLLPSYEENLLVAVDSPAGEDQQTVALWIGEKTVDDLFAAFALEGLFLAAVSPRVLEFKGSSPKQSVIDVDADTVTCVVLENKVPVQWLHVNKIDFEQAEFVEQWEQLASDSDADNSLLMDSAQKYNLQTKANSIGFGKGARHYCFFPNGALNASKKTAKSKRLVLGAAAMAVLVFIAAIPFIRQSLEARRLAADLASQRDFSFEARQDQAIVVNFDNEWGPLNDFPDQRIRAAMFTLQGVLSPDTLSSLEINEGLIKIQGTSAEPQALLQRLEQDPMFTEVAFSRATNNSRYYIDLRLSPVNFEGYMVRYFPDN